MHCRHELITWKCLSCFKSCKVHNQNPFKIQRRALFMGDYWTSHLKIISSSEANYAQTGNQIWFQFCQGTVEFQAYLLNRVEWSEAFLTFSSWQPGSTCCRHFLSCPLLLGGTPAGQLALQITSVWGSIRCKWYSRINEHPLKASSQYVTLRISVSPM